jgi:cytochrome c6
VKSFQGLWLYGLMVVLASPVLASPDLALGEKTFKANCLACHAGGRNSVNPAKTLKLEDLKKNKKDTAQAIIYEITNGKAPMPAFGKKLSPEQIESLAAYVLDKANKGWK